MGQALEVPLLDSLLVDKKSTGWRWDTQWQSWLWLPWELEIPSGWARRGKPGSYLLLSLTLVSRKFMEQILLETTSRHMKAYHAVSHSIFLGTQWNRLEKRTTRWWNNGWITRLQGLWSMVQSPTDGQSLGVSHGRDLRPIPGSILVNAYGSPRQGDSMYPQQVYSWQHIGGQMGRWGKAVSALKGRADIWMGLNRLPETSWSSREKSAESWGSAMRVLGLGLGYLRRSSAGKNFQVLVAASETGMSSEPMLWLRIIPYWAVLLHHGQVKGRDSCPLLGTCETMPGQLCLALGSSVQREKHKTEEVSQRDTRMVKVTYRDKGPVFIWLDEKTTTEGYNFSLQLQRRQLHALLEVHRERLRGYKWIAGKRN